jgi:hypothetical protein
MHTVNCSCSLHESTLVYIFPLLNLFYSTCALIFHATPCIWLYNRASHVCYPIYSFTFTRKPWYTKIFLITHSVYSKICTLDHICYHRIIIAAYGSLLSMSMDMNCLCVTTGKIDAYQLCTLYKDLIFHYVGFINLSKFITLWWCLSHATLLFCIFMSNFHLFFRFIQVSSELGQFRHYNHWLLTG